MGLYSVLQKLNLCTAILLALDDNNRFGSFMTKAPSV